MLPFITSMQLAMYDNDQSVSDTRRLRWHLWDPYQESETDCLIWDCPLFSTIFAGLAMDGLGFAPMGFGYRC